MGSVASDDRLRQLSGDRRMGQLRDSGDKNNASEITRMVRECDRFGKNALENGWQQFEALVSPPEPSAVRGKSDIVGAIAPVIRLLEPHQIEQTRRHAAGVLGEPGVGNPEAIDALTQLLHTAREEETRWQAALSLGKISPGHPQAGIRKARYLDLGMS